mgnify:CR=1 FL=1
MKKVLLLMLMFVILLVGCGASEEETPTPLVSPLTQVSPVGTPVVDFAPTPVSPPSSGTGTVQGRLVDYETGVTELINGLPLYLGSLVEMDPGDSYVITMSPSQAPSTWVDTQGYFAFTDITPGTYALVIWTPMNTWVLSDPETQNSILVTITEGQINDVGEIFVNLPRNF